MDYLLRHLAYVIMASNSEVQVILTTLLFSDLYCFPLHESFRFLAAQFLNWKCIFQTLQFTMIRFELHVGLIRIPDL